MSLISRAAAIEAIERNAYRHTYNDPDYGCSFEENGDMDSIVAWMPLPEPYQKQGD